MSAVDGITLETCSMFISTNVPVGSTSDTTLSSPLSLPLAMQTSLCDEWISDDDDCNEGNLSEVTEWYGDGLTSDSVTTAVVCGGATGSATIVGADFLAWDLCRAFTCCSWLIASSNYSE